MLAGSVRYDETGRSANDVPDRRSSTTVVTDAAAPASQIKTSTRPDGAATNTVTTQASPIRQATRADHRAARYVRAPTASAASGSLIDTSLPYGDSACAVPSRGRQRTTRGRQAAAVRPSGYACHFGGHQPDGWGVGHRRGRGHPDRVGFRSHGPEVEAQVSYCRAAAGSPDWDEDRSVMVSDRRVLMTMTVDDVYGAKSADRVEPAGRHYLRHRGRRARRPVAWRRSVTVFGSLVVRRAV